MHFLKIAFITLTIGLLHTQAESLSPLQQTQQAKLEAAIQQLNQQRSEIQSQQIPLAQKLNTLETQAKDLRQTLDQARFVRDSRALDLQTLKQTVEAQRKEYEYITRNLFDEYISNYQAALSVAELATYGQSINQLNQYHENPTVTEAEKLQKSLTLITNSLQRIESTLGGKTYNGQALSNDGFLIDGTYIQLGPLLYFSDAAGQQVGIIQENKALQPRIHPLNTEQNQQITTLAKLGKLGKGDLPMDLSLGNALALESTQDTPLEHLKKGGIWVYPIIAFAFTALIVALIKFVQIMSIRQPAPNTIHELVKLVRNGDTEQAFELAEAQPKPAREMLTQAIALSNESLELVEESMYEAMLSTQPKLEKYLNVIAVTASVAPLLGLLGTVTGIIKTFNLMKVFGAGDPKPLISGISEALITTELGLVLAIPALVIHAILSRKVAGVMAHIEKLSVAFINGLSRRRN